MATGKIAKQIIFTESLQVSIGANNDYFYLNAKTGYHLVSAMISNSWSGSQDTIIGLAWSGYNYIAFLKAADASARTKNVMLVWVKN